MNLIFNNLPKISNNKFYEGGHWAKRKTIKDNFAKIVRLQFWAQTSRRSFTSPCDVHYIFEFKSKPLDCSNCVGMLKMIEDVLFPDDSIKVVKSINVVSLKSIEDKVTVIIK